MVFEQLQSYSGKHFVQQNEQIRFSRKWMLGDTSTFGTPIVYSSHFQRVF